MFNPFKKKKENQSKSKVVMPKKVLPLSDQEKTSQKIEQRIARRKKIVKIVLVVILVCVLSGVGYAAYAFSGIFKNSSKLKSLFFTNKVTPASLSGEGAGRINYLVMGYGGSGHDGPYLTDTMMVISVDPYNHQVAILSIPRDLWVQIPGFSSAKINSAFSDGEAQNGNLSDGANLAKQVVGNILDLPINYYVALDFSGFSQMINSVGGIDIYVGQAIDDPYFPTDNYSYTTYQISVGWHHMDGAAALDYARSRETTSDFSRAARQQQVITAYKQKVLDLGFWSDPIKVASMLSGLQNNLSTDLTPQELVQTFELVQNVKEDQIAEKVLDDSSGGLLYAATSSDGQDILLPKDATWEQVRALAHSIFTEPFLEKENPSIMIENASGVSGNAYNVSQVLTDRGYPNVNYEASATLSPTTTIMDCSNGAKPYTLALLQKRFLNASTTSCSAVDKKVDFVITLGQNFDYNNFITNTN